MLQMYSSRAYSGSPLDHISMLLMLNQRVYRSKSCNCIPRDLQDESQLNNHQKEVLANYYKYMMKNPIDIQIAQLSELYPWTDCIIQAKADGQRCLLVINQNIVYLVFEKTLEVIGSSELSGLTVFECELMTQHNQSPHLLVYDQQMWQNDPICTQVYFYRIVQLQKQLDKIWLESQINEKRVMFLKAKKFVQIRKNFDKQQITKAFKQIQDSGFQSDGLIINTNNVLQYQQIYKWKSINKLTIDFLCIQVDQNIYELQSFCPILKKSVRFTSPIVDCSYQYETSNPLDMKIGEFVYNTDFNLWQLVKIRYDKMNIQDPDNVQESPVSTETTDIKQNPLLLKGNSLKTARNILSNIIYNITFEMLCDGISDNYFEFKRSDLYKNMTRFINNAKQDQIAKIYSQLKSQNIDQLIVLDLGCGKGQDILKFQDFDQVYCVDNDKFALWELNQRTSALKTGLKVKTIQSDLSHWESIQLLPQNVQFLNCNLALHYFADMFPYIVKTTTPLIINLLILDGSLLKDEESYFENGKEKYHYYKKEGTTDQLMIRLPFKSDFSQETILYPDQITSTLNELNYQLELKKSLTEYQQLEYNQELQLSSADFKHISNYTVLQYKLK